MLSELFKRFAAKGGINLFNWKEKTSWKPTEIQEPTEDKTYGQLIMLSQTYFRRLVVQTQYIKTLHGLLDSIDGEIQNLDCIQAGYEATLNQAFDKAAHAKEVQELRWRIDRLVSKLKITESILNHKNLKGRQVQNLSADIRELIETIKHFQK